VSITRRESSLFSLLARLYGHVNRRRRYQGFLLLALTFVSSAAEVVSLGAIIPFIGILTQPERAMQSASVGAFARWLGITSASDLVLPLTLAFAAAAVVAGALRLTMIWASLRIATATGTDFGLDVYRRTLYQPYRVHITRSSSEIISGITQKIAAVVIVLMSAVTLVTSSILFVAIMIALVSFEPMVAGASLLVFGAGYGLIAWQSRRRLARNSSIVAREQIAVIKALQEGLGGIRDVLLDGTQKVYIDSYERSMRPLQRATGENIFMGQAPRYAMETLGMVLVAGLAYTITRNSSDVGTALPILGALGLGAQRLLPLLQQMYGAWSYVAGSRGSLVDVLVLLDQPMSEEAGRPLPAPMEFAQAVEFRDVCFRYADAGPWILENISLRIERGSRVGIVGTTGSGKSTTLDLLMALIDPTEGEILVDGRPVSGTQRRAWQQAIAHVPQNIYLSDTTIAENIALGVRANAIDMDRVREAARRAQIAEFIESRPGGYQAIVGERGISLSGGQRQRIGIARALYKRASVLILDEATNALDSTTETAVMEGVEQLSDDLTIVFVAHRVSTLEHCDLIIQLEGGRIRARGSYKSLLENGGDLSGLPSSASVAEH
jgi:ATP-binding cassette, subfamily B, bacterial PglK